MNKTMLGMALGLVTLASSPAFALAGYVAQIPNAPAPGQCNTCHTSGGGTPRNLFGQDVEANLTGSTVSWAAICGLDSDGDGETNGAELGDPCCVWTRSDGVLSGATTSLPADPSSTSGNVCDPGAGDGDGDGDGDTDGGTDGDGDTGGCGARQVEGSSMPAAAAALFGALALLARRRRR